MAGVCLLLLLAVTGADAVGKGRRVLLIASYHPGFPTFFKQVGGLRGVLEPAGVALDVEFMDTKRFPVAEAVPRFLDLMRFKLGNSPAYDVIAVADDAALRFVLDNRLELFAERPVVFFGVNDLALAHGLGGRAGFTGVIESVSMLETLEDVRRLLPRAGAVHAVVDDQPGGQGDLRTFLALQDRLPGLRLEVLPLTEWTWEELGRRLEAVPRGDAVLLLSAFRDRAAETKSFDEGLAFVLRHAQVPVFHLWEHGLGQGLLGGKIISHEAQGRLAGGLVLRILSGEAAETLPVIEGEDANRHLFDHAVLTRFGIDESLLPPDSEVRGRPVSAFSRYRTQILVLAGGVSVLLGLVAALMIHVVRLRRAKSRLMDSEARYKALFDANADGILVAECDTRRFVFANPTVCRMFGYSVEEFRGLGVADIHPPEHLAEVIANFDQQARGERDIAEGSPCLRRDGSVFLADIRSFLLEIDGRPCAVGLFRDVTERSLVLEALRHARDAAEAANRSKSEFLANMSHEIRTPLNGVTGMLQLLEVSSPTPEQQEYIRLALSSSMRLTRLLADILDLSRIEAGKLALESRPFRLEEVRQSTLSLLSMAAREKGLSLDFELDPGLPDLLAGDQARLQQVLFNLAGNGIKFTQEGGVRVQASPLSANGDGRLRVLFTVEDTGIGISDELLEAVFQPFVQGEGAYVRRFQGAGLGLSIVRRLVRLMGGTLAVDNGPGGTTFCLSLPFASAPGPAGSEAGTGRVQRAAGLGRKILLAEDDEISRRTVAAMLRGFGHHVVAVPDGRQAVLRVREEDFDAVVMDIQMPLMDGVEATRVIRSDASLGAMAQVPIIAMTAYAMAGDREKFLAAGMDGYVPKPVDMEGLRDAIDRIAERRPETASKERGR
jgi:PAS domain S-box-containing protein